MTQFGVTTFQAPFSSVTIFVAWDDACFIPGPK